ncbi:MAG TPA: hypothetical protein VN181_07175, partial [Thermoanaerobaculia bacterium]|nr:hypothetical protein [Thermoanaerobaculia bacterium]
HWRALADATESLVVITGSCGLEILNQSSDERDPIEHVIALGPVARSRPRAPHTLVQGTRDPFSKFFFRRCDVELPGVGHMNYLEDERVLRLTHQLCSNTSRFSAAASISRGAG